ncbi:sulfotransferase family protein [Halomonas sp. LS-001]
MAPAEKKQNEPENKREVVVVLGVGRSGTSLAMQALQTLGVRVSENMIPANVSNPKGFGEDADIVEIHKALLQALTPNPSMPLIEGWQNTPEAKKALQQLKTLVEQQVDAGPEIWAFKDPRTATFLPLWMRLFNQLKIVPRFILAIRQPNAVISSFAQQYGNDQAFAELIFLLRTLDALHHTGGNCHLLPYEDWFKHPSQTLQQLADFVFDSATDLKGVEPPIVPTLNRAGYTDITIRNPMVRSLYQSLEACAHEQQPRDVLMQQVQEQRDMIEGFMPWSTFARNQQQQKQKFQQQTEQAQQKAEQHVNCQQQLQRHQAALTEWQHSFSALERLLHLY